MHGLMLGPVALRGALVALLLVAAASFLVGNASARVGTPPGVFDRGYSGDGLYYTGYPYGPFNDVGQIFAVRHGWLLALDSAGGGDYSGSPSLLDPVLVSAKGTAVGPLRGHPGAIADDDPRRILAVSSASGRPVINRVDLRGHPDRTLAGRGSFKLDGFLGVRGMVTDAYGAGALIADARSGATFNSSLVIVTRAGRVIIRPSTSGIDVGIRSAIVAQRRFTFLTAGGTLERFTDLGRPDETFGDHGVATDPAISDAKLLVAGPGSSVIAIAAGLQGLAVTRIDQRGVRDPSFGTATWDSPFAGRFTPESAVLDHGGDLFVGGEIAKQRGPGSWCALIRLDRHGHIDRQWGDDALARQDPGHITDCTITHLIPDQAGYVITAGYTFGHENDDTGLGRTYAYLGRVKR